MSISNIDEAQKRKWAGIFADIYIKDGPTEAGKWAIKTIPQKYHHEMLDEVKQAFDDRGWELIKEEEEDLIV